MCCEQNGGTVIDMSLDVDMKFDSDMEGTTEQFSPIPDQPTRKVTDFTGYKVGIFLHRYYLPCLIILGLIGNSLSLRVMTLKRNRKFSCSMYLAALAVTDNVFLISSAFYWAVTEITNSMATWSCKLIGMVFITSASYGEYLVVALTIDRLCAVVCPLRARRWSSPERSRRVIMVGGGGSDCTPLPGVLYHGCGGCRENLPVFLRS